MLETDGFILIVIKNWFLIMINIDTPSTNIKNNKQFEICKCVIHVLVTSVFHTYGDDVTL
jgi:hypothetical protein